MTNSRSRSEEKEFTPDSTLLERGVMRSHDKGQGYSLVKELGQMLQYTTMINLVSFG